MRSIGNNGATAVAIAVGEEADKDKKRRRRNRGSKKNTSPEGALSNPMNSICGPPPELLENGSGVLGAHPLYVTPTPLKLPETTFSSLPPIHIFEDHAGSSEVQEEVSQISQSCPVPSTSYFTPVKSREFPVASKEERRKWFDPYWLDHAIEDAIMRGSAFKAKFRVNAHNRVEAYCTVDGLQVDVMVNGIVAQNRAIEGDTVAITLDPVTNWTKMKGANSPSNQGLEDIPSSNSKVIPITGVLQLNKKGCSTSTNPSTENGHDIRTPYPSDQMETVEKTDYERALERIKAVITSNPSKRPTGRVVCIIKRSPRREAVVGFIVPTPLLPEIEFNGKGTDFKLGMRKNKNDTISAIHLVPNDPRLPKMAVNIDNLPDVARERVEKGDVTIKKELIAARIDEWNEESLFPVAQVVDVLGPGCEIETQIAAILFEHAIDTAKFSLDSRSCVPGPSWAIPEEEVTARRDLRNVLTFTIDPASAIDLDDALSIEMVSDGVFRIGVHIADVSYFVWPNSSLDKEAQVRSTSVYMVQHKLSMLPEELSQGCATLSPGLDRLTMSVIWDVDSSGNILDRWIGRSVIFSCCKLSYDLVQDVIDTGFIPYRNGSTIPQVYGKYQWKDVVKSLKSIYNLSQKLNEIRFRDGALSLGNSKLAFLFDEGGLPCDSYRSDERIEACLLVEEFMLLANRSVAEVIASAFPDCALLRRHPQPNLRRLKEFEVFCGRLGIELDASSSGQLHFSLSKIRENLKDDPFLFNIIVSYASKPMQSAMYFCTGDLKGKKDEWGHYALSLPFYTHFTSPIRRYPDILVHRTLLAVMDAEVCLKRREATFGNSTSEVRCFTGLNFDRGMAESKEGKDALLGAAIKFRVPGVEVLGELAEYFNERKLASCHAEDAGRKVYLWALLKHKQVLISEARVMGLGPKFMSVYVQKLACEKRIYYDEVEGLAADWLECTATLVLDLYRKRPYQKKGTSYRYRPIEDVALIENPSEESEVMEVTSSELCPAAFPLVLHHLSSVQVALHAVGGDDGPVDIGVRLYASSYFC